MQREKLLCNACDGAIEGRLYLRCNICDGHFDLTCANVSEKRFYNTMTPEHKLKWRCVTCMSKEYVPRSDSTPATPASSELNYVNQRRGASINSPVSLNISAEKTTTSVSLEMIVAELGQFRSEFVKEMQASREQLKKLNDSFSKLVARVESCESRLDSITCRIESIEHRIEGEGVTGYAQNVTLMDTVQELKAELNQRDQDVLLNHIEISCIPECNSENLEHVAITLATKLGVNLTEKDIVHATRVGRALESAEVVGVGPMRRPRSIVVSLTRRALRDQLLKAARVRRGATTEGTGLPGPARRFYINERLTQVNRLLFRRARELAEQHRWRFVWTRDGRIYARQHAGKDAPRHRIRMEADLDRVFHNASV